MFGFFNPFLWLRSAEKARLSRKVMELEILLSRERRTVFDLRHELVDSRRDADAMREKYGESIRKLDDLATWMTDQAVVPSADEPPF